MSGQDLEATESPVDGLRGGTSNVDFVRELILMVELMRTV